MAYREWLPIQGRVMLTPGERSLEGGVRHWEWTWVSEKASEEICNGVLKEKIESWREFLGTETRGLLVEGTALCQAWAWSVSLSWVRRKGWTCGRGPATGWPGRTGGEVSEIWVGLWFSHTLGCEWAGPWVLHSTSNQSSSALIWTWES